MFPQFFDLSKLNGKNGFEFRGINPTDNNNDNAGWYVSGIGDLNDDDIDDFAVGAPGFANDLSSWSGRVYIIFGSNKTFPAYFDNSYLNGRNGFTITLSPESPVSLGSFVSAIKDVNNDNIDDIAIGTSPALGNVYIIFGSKNQFNSSFNLANLDGKNGFIINGVDSLSSYSGNPGTSISGVGDFNGDKKNDFIIGFSWANDARGQSAIIFGNESFDTYFNVSNLDGTNGFNIKGDLIGSWSGWDVSGVGDVNKDGFSDVAIGAPGGVANNGMLNYVAGRSYVVFGHNGSFPKVFSLSDLNGDNGFYITSKNGPLPDNDGETEQLGYSISGGDLNNDNFSDIFVSEGHLYVFVFFGQSKFQKSIDTGELNGSNGFYCYAGFVTTPQQFISVGNAGDVNGDKIIDLIFGDPNQNEACILFGSESPFAKATVLPPNNQANGFCMVDLFDSDDHDDDIPNDDNQPHLNLGWSVSGVGDVTGDKVDDIIVGAPKAHNNAGKAYLILGQLYPPPSPSFSPQPSQIPPSSSPNHHVTPTPSSSAGNESNAGEFEIIGGIVGGLVAAGLAAGFFIYGKNHDWWCAGESTSVTEGYTAVN